MTDKKKDNLETSEADELATVAAIGLHPIENSDMVVSVLAKNQKNDKSSQTDKAASDKAGAPKREAVLRTSPLNASGVQDYDPPSSAWINVLVVSLMLLWVIAAGLISYRFLDIANLSTLDVWQFLGLAMLFLVPLITILLMGYGFRRLDDMSKQSERLSRSAQYLTQIDDQLAGHTADLARNVVGEIQRMEDGLQQTALRVQGLRDMLSGEAEKLESLGNEFDLRRLRIEKTLTDEREAIQKTTKEFENRFAKLATSLTKNTSELDKSVSNAEKRIEKAQQGFQAVTIRANSAADILKAFSAQANNDLGAKHIQIQNLSDDMKSQFEALEEVYERKLEKTQDMVRSLRQEHAEITREVDEYRQQALQEKAPEDPASSGKALKADEQTETLNPQIHDDLALNYHTEDIPDYAGAPSKSSQKAGWNSSPSNKERTNKERETQKQSRRLNLRPAPDLLSGEYISSDLEGHDKGSVAEKNEHTVSEAKSLSLEPHDPKYQDQKPIDPVKSASPAPGSFSWNERDEGLNLSTPEPPNIYTDDEKSDFSRQIQQSQESELYQKSLPLGDVDNVNPPPDLQTQDAPDDHLVRRPFEQSDDATRASWWRNLLGIGPARSSDYAIDTLVGTQPSRRASDSDLIAQGLQPPLQADRAQSDVSQSGKAHADLIDLSEIPASDTLINQLSAIGLTPSVIIDDGCIDEAVNMRIQHGPKAMSLTTARRLGEPIRYLRENLAADPQLKNEAIQFASRFHKALSSFNNDEISLRQRLQSSEGRAFLLCDAAMNS